jgi:ketosteroid isomerase-like protein
MRTRMAVLFPIALVIGCAGSDTAETAETGAAEDPAVVRQAIEQANAEVVAAMKAGDAAKIISYYDAETIVMPSEMPVHRGQQANLTNLTEFLTAVTVTDFSLTTEDVMVKDDIAIETGSNTMTIQPKQAGAPAMGPDKGKYLAVWKKQADGSWKKVRDIWNSDAPPPAAR